MTHDSQHFLDPPSEFRPIAFWAWNDDMTKERIREQLRKMKACGFGGAFVHPRPGLVTPYLSEEWFALWSVALSEAERLDLKLNIYDENSYPSGFAGGHIPSELPDCLASAVILRELAYAELADSLSNVSVMLNRPGHPIHVFAFHQNGKADDEIEIVKDVTFLPLKEWPHYSERFLVFEIGKPETNAWLGGFAYTDLLRPEVTELFLRNTYEAYFRRYREKFGDRIQAVFTDEPEISPGNLFRQNGSDFLPFSYWFAGQFEARNGYDIKDYFPCLFRNVSASSFDKDPRKVRYDYYHTIHELWVENFLRPISAWCSEHRIAWTGHFVEHNWPFPWGRTSPAVMSLYEYMQWPAIDILRADNLRKPEFEGTEMLMLVIREASSVSNQFERERVVCEAFGAGGWDSDFKDYKRIGDWLFVHGINYLVPHLTLSSLIGARKRDHPQSFDWRQSWWDELKELNLYFGRLSYLLAQGKTCNRILLLNPCLSAFMGTPGSQQGELRVNDPPNPPDMSTFLRIVQRLCDLGWNYDLGDEYIMERHGNVLDGRLFVGKRGYDVVIYPDSMTTMKVSTFRLLERFLQTGGIVLAMGGPSERMDGMVNPETQKLQNYKNWVPVRDAEQLNDLLTGLLPKELEWVEPANIPPGVHYLHRLLPDGSSLYFIANSYPGVVQTAVRMFGAYVEEWNPWTRHIEGVSCRRIGNRVEVDVTLPEEGSILLRVYEQPISNAVVKSPSKADQHGIRSQVSLSGPTTVLPERDNLLVLDYCDLLVGNKSYHGISVIHAQKLIYEAHGFESNPWDNAVQFKRRLLDRNKFPERSGFVATYRFHVADGGLPDRLTLWVERGEYYQLLVNGQAVKWSDESTDLDHHICVADITEYVAQGENFITLRAQPFDLFMELENVILSGSFTVRQKDGKWAIDKPASMTIGSWKSQGYPFYGYAVNYENTVMIEDVTKRYAVRLPKWSGTVASLYVNGSMAGMFGVGRGEEVDISAYVKKGENRIRVRVCGSFKNLLGPFHDPAHTRKTAWPYFWKTAPIQGPPNAADYDLLDFGLFEEFIVISHSNG